MKPQLKIPRELRRELDAAGLRWQARNGKRHIKLFIEGKLTGVLNHSGNDGRAAGGAHAAVRRLIKQRR